MESKRKLTTPHTTYLLQVAEVENMQMAEVENMQVAEVENMQVAEVENMQETLKRS